MSFLVAQPLAHLTVLAVLVTFKGLTSTYPPATPSTNDLIKPFSKDLADRISYCSDNRADTILNYAKVEIPPNGTSSWGYDYSYLKCTGDDRRSWAEAVHRRLHQDYAKAIPNLDEYNAIVMIFPKKWPLSKQCDFLGYAEASTQQPHSYVWINANGWNNAGLMMHEIGHTLNLRHAYYDGKEYNDATTPMGYCNPTCYSPPEQWRLGWLQESKTTYINTCGSHKLTLPRSTTWDTIVVGSLTSSKLLFIQYREYDDQYDQLQPDYRNSVLLHEYTNILDDPSPSLAPAVLQAALKRVGDTFTHNPTNSQITLTSLTETIFTIAVSIPCPAPPPRKVLQRNFPSPPPKKSVKTPPLPPPIPTAPSDEVNGNISLKTKKSKKSKKHNNKRYPPLPSPPTP